MPAVANNLLIVEQRLWTVALAWPALASSVRVGNRIRFDQLGIPFPESKGHRAPADSVELKLDVPGLGVPDSRAVATFCLQPDVTTYDFAWTLTANTKQLAAVTQVHAELKAAMVAAGSQLGIPAVVARWRADLRPSRGMPNERQYVWVQHVTVKS